MSQLQIFQNEESEEEGEKMIFLEDEEDIDEIDQEIEKNEEELNKLEVQIQNEE